MADLELPGYLISEDTKRKLLELIRASKGGDLKFTFATASHPSRQIAYVVANDVIQLPLHDGTLQQYDAAADQWSDLDGAVWVMGAGDDDELCAGNRYLCVRFGTATVDEDTRPVFVCMQGPSVIVKCGTQVDGDLWNGVVQILDTNALSWGDGPDCYLFFCGGEAEQDEKFPAVPLGSRGPKSVYGTRGNVTPNTGCGMGVDTSGNLVVVLSDLTQDPKMTGLNWYSGTPCNYLGVGVGCGLTSVGDTSPNKYIKVKSADIAGTGLKAHDPSGLSGCALDVVTAPPLVALTSGTYSGGLTVTASGGGVVVSTSGSYSGGIQIVTQPPVVITSGSVSITYVNPITVNSSGSLTVTTVNPVTVNSSGAITVTTVNPLTVTSGSLGLTYCSPFTVSSSGCLQMSLGSGLSLNSSGMVSLGSAGSATNAVLTKSVVCQSGTMTVTSGTLSAVVPIGGINYPVQFTLT